LLLPTIIQNLPRKDKLSGARSVDYLYLPYSNTVSFHAWKFSVLT